MGWRTIFKIAEKEEQGKQVATALEQVSLLSHVPPFTHVLTDMPTEHKHQFQERAAIREFDGNQSKLEAELGALVEVMPFLEIINGRERLVLPVNAPLKYLWWQDGQDPETTLREFGASEETISKYVSQLGGRKFP